jgi:S-DNA-T family DNA segregation ATPase FtsK/SpoIIIE
VVGVAERDLSPAVLRVAPGAHVVVAGPPGSGRTTALATLAASARAAGARVVVLAPGAPAPTDVVAPEGVSFVFVDDADRWPADDPVLTALATGSRSGTHLVVGVRADRVRVAYGHWVRELLAHRTGLLLQPDADLDGDLLDVRLPRRFAVALRPGRAWSVGDPHGDGIVQVAVTDQHERH